MALYCVWSLASVPRSCQTSRALRHCPALSTVWSPFHGVSQVATFYEKLGTRVMRDPDQDTNDLEKCLQVQRDGEGQHVDRRWGSVYSRGVP